MKPMPLIMLFSACFYQCAQQTDKPDLEKARQEIVALEQTAREIHFKKKVTEFVSLLSDSVFMINRGEVSRPTPADNTARFGNYFRRVEFLKWDDITPPVIIVSEDGKMAYSIVQKEVEITYKNELNKTLKENKKYAWLSVYRKYGDTWKLEINASTNAPETITEIKDIQ